MSCVRASTDCMGCVADIRGMNVALTRAKRALWVSENANALKQCDDWVPLISDAKGRNCYLDMESLPKKFLVTRGSTYTPLPGKSFAYTRGLVVLGIDIWTCVPNEVLLDDLDDLKQLVARNAWPYGIQKKQNSASLLGRRDH
ncbi:hypothetical protein MKW94_020211 [Papaver nudicaule]|uniref:DNA2/NAM7 helicase-like C-terminal domain-containing protein n=1 Tax=Papaver nudicaule TaxID=74823 RepID=A0AA42B3C1_PAPNU|nr:hypothetical protein [Papaver nudicaule]